MWTESANQENQRGKIDLQSIMKSLNFLHKEGVLGLLTLYSVLNECPHEQLFVTFGLFILKPAPIKLSM